MEVGRRFSGTSYNLHNTHYATYEMGANQHIFREPPSYLISGKTSTPWAGGTSGSRST